MSEMPTALKLCADRYASSKSPCRGCPVIKECHRTHLPTWHHLLEWRRNLEAAAKNHIELMEE